MVMFIIQNTIFPQLIPTPGELLFSSLKFKFYVPTLWH